LAVLPFCSRPPFVVAVDVLMTAAAALRASSFLIQNPNLTGYSSFIAYLISELANVKQNNSSFLKRQFIAS